MAWDNLPLCYDEIQIQGKGFKRPGTPTQPSSALLTSAGPNLNPHDYETGNLNHQYQSNLDQCDGFNSVRRLKVQAGHNDVNWEIWRSVLDAQLNNDAQLHIISAAQAGDNTDFADMADAFSFEAGTINITLNLGVFSLILPDLGGLSNNGVWSHPAKSFTIKRDGDIAHIAGDPINFVENIASESYFDFANNCIDAGFEVTTLVTTADYAPSQPSPSFEFHP